MNTSLKNRAYQHIRSKLMNGKLAPGSPLSQRKLADEIGMSFTPVRDAMTQLVNEGLLTQYPRLGTFVMELTREELEEIYDVREAMESHAVLGAAGRLSEEDLAEMEAQCRQMLSIVEQLDAAEGKWSGDLMHQWRVADAAFHITLLRSAGNRRAVKIVNELHVMSSIFAQWAALTPLGDANHICKEHARIVELLGCGDARTASGVMREHIRNGCRIALSAYQRGRANEAARTGPGIMEPGPLYQEIHDMESLGVGEQTEERDDAGRRVS